ncbi:MAG TPA: serine hydrolase [Gemmatimonadaceae bacterium]|nr:serine hydrolase [Gemmatimonadaceae bacterium]
MKLHTIVLALLAIALPVATPAQTRSAADYMAAIEGAQPTAGPNDLSTLTITALLARFNVPGVSIAVIRDHQIHWAKGYGIADVATGAPVDTGTMFQAASISKPVAAMAVLRAVQDGLFTLDTDINTILTSWKLDGGQFTRDGPVTPRTLTSHTSGLGDGFGFPGYNPTDSVPTVVQFLQGSKLSNVGVIFMERPPMTLMEYSGGGVTLMQQALSDARRKPFADIMRDDVLRPLGMTRSTFEQPLPESFDRNAARAHSGEGKAMGAKWHVYPEQAAAGLWTTPSDLARLVIEVQRASLGQLNRVLSRATIQEMLSPVGVGDYAVGFSIAKIGQGWYFGHGGSNWGFRATLLAHKVKGYGLVIMTNADQGGAVASELSRRIQRAYAWDSFAEPAPRGYRPPVERTEITVAESVLRNYVGEYQLTPQLSITITFEDGRLQAQPTGQSKAPLFAEAPDKFFLRVANVQVTFTKTPSGEVAGLILHQGGRDQTGRKVK